MLNEKYLYYYHCFVSIEQVLKHIGNHCLECFDFPLNFQCLLLFSLCHLHWRSFKCCLTCDGFKSKCKCVWMNVNSILVTFIQKHFLLFWINYYLIKNFNLFSFMNNFTFQYLVFTFNQKTPFHWLHVFILNHLAITFQHTMLQTTPTSHDVWWLLLPPCNPSNINPQNKSPNSNSHLNPIPRCETQHFDLKNYKM
jgi:hypothetical protein